MSALRENKRIVYNLTKRYGRLIHIQRVISRDLNARTGKQVVNHEILKVRKAVVMPFTVLRDFSYPLSYIAANKNFTYGALFDRKKSTILIGRKDLPKDFRFANDHQILFNDQTFEVTDHLILPENAGILVNVQLQGYDSGN